MDCGGEENDETSRGKPMQMGDDEDEQNLMAATYAIAVEKGERILGQRIELFD